MRSGNKLAYLSLPFVFLLFFAAVASYSEIALPEKPPDYVVDLAGIINAPEERRLSAYLRELERKTTAQMVVLTINSLEGEALEEFSIEVAHDKWKLGQKGKDNGILLLVALQEKKYRFEIGYGLEGVIPDSRAGSIGRQYLVPYFRRGEYSRGILAASSAVISEIAADAGVEITGAQSSGARSPYSYKKSARGKPGVPGTIITIIFFIGLIYMFIRHPRLLLLILMFSMMGGGRRSGWGGGGGFGGGGGGGFGGGGASGGW